jgi:hypothetical protein
MDAIGFLKWFGLVVGGLGGALSAGAMLFGTVDSQARMTASLRGMFQLREHYTKSGWRMYWIGVTTVVTGLLLMLIGLVLRPGF